MENLRNIGIFAHVDAGKTTLSERLLAHAGAIRQAGSVDSGTAHTDDLPVERRRGISVKATCVRLKWRNTDVNLIDTPGHVDFSAEVERSFWALDSAVLVICAASGVQPQTEALYHALVQQGVPMLIFINKTDREGADVARTLLQIHRQLTPRAALMTDADSIAEVVCDTDEALMERYIAGEALSGAELKARMAELSRNAEAIPVFAGSALRDTGVEALLDAIITCLPPAPMSDKLCGVVFAARQDAAVGRGAWVRLYGGTLENRTSLTLPAGIDPLTGEERQVQRKITQIRDVDGCDKGRLTSGEIGVVYGLGDISVGYVLGDEAALPRRFEPGRFRTPLITAQVVPEDDADMPALREACAALSGEDPLLKAQYIRSLGELHLHAMGAIQLEIIEELLRTRFGISARFMKPAVIYRETIARAAEGFVAYTMPKPCWAVLSFLIEPGERGSGVTFKSVAPVRDIMARYQHQVEQALPLALNQGRLGWQVTDVKITLLGGNHHLIHTHPLDFIVATPMGIQDGLERGGSVLLEPMLDVRLYLPPECVGRVMSDVAAMRGEVLETLTDGERVTMTAVLPVATSMDYPTQLASLTNGRGAITTRLQGYRECATEPVVTARRRGVDPLDTSKYILAARSALEGGIFDLD